MRTFNRRCHYKLFSSMLVIGMRTIIFMRELSDINTTFWTETITTLCTRIKIVLFFDIFDTILLKVDKRLSDCNCSSSSSRLHFVYMYRNIMREEEKKNIIKKKSSLFILNISTACCLAD
jgi:hypothetical protein